MRMSEDKLTYVADRVTQALLKHGSALELDASRDEVYREVILALRHDAEREAAIEDKAARKIRSMKRPVAEDSPEWSTLLRRFIDEELDKLRVVRKDW